jgi:hypothetical protein
VTVPLEADVADIALWSTSRTLTAAEETEAANGLVGNRNRPITKALENEVACGIGATPD